MTMNPYSAPNPEPSLEQNHVRSPLVWLSCTYLALALIQFYLILYMGNENGAIDSLGVFPFLVTGIPLFLKMIVSICLFMRKPSAFFVFIALAISMVGVEVYVSFERGGWNGISWFQLSDILIVSVIGFYIYKLRSKGYFSQKKRGNAKSIMKELQRDEKPDN